MLPRPAFLSIKYKYAVNNSFFSLRKLHAQANSDSTPDRGIQSKATSKPAKRIATLSHHRSVHMPVPESESATPVPNAPKLQILLPALPRPKTLPRRPPLLPLPLSLFHRRRPLILPSPFNKSLHPHGADGVEEVIHPDPRWPGASACLGRTRAEAALGTAAVADADAAEEGGRVVRRVG